MPSLSPQDLLDAMQSSGALQEVISHPWHLKVDVTLFDEIGKHPNNGSIEVWKSGTNQKTVITFGSSVHTELLVDGKKFSNGAGEPSAYLADEVLEEFLHPGPQKFDIEDATPEVRKQKIGNQEFNCLMLSRSIKNVRQAPLGLFPTYCSLESSIEPRLSFPAGADVFERQRLGTFLGQRVTMELSVTRGTVQVAHATVSSLATYPDGTIDFKPTSDMSHVNPDVALVPAKMIAVTKLSGANPRYPVKAQHLNISGPVVLHAIIGVDGHIHSLQVVSTPDPDLALASLSAVRMWQYRPYLINGEPTSVDTMITIAFR